MKNNYHETFVVIRLMTYIHVKLTFTCYLFRLYKKHVEKEEEIKQKWFLEDKKIKIKYINALKIE